MWMVMEGENVVEGGNVVESENGEIETLAPILYDTQFSNTRGVLMPPPSRYVSVSACFSTISPLVPYRIVHIYWIYHKRRINNFTFIRISTNNPQQTTNNFSFNKQFKFHKFQILKLWGTPHGINY